MYNNSCLVRASAHKLHPNSHKQDLARATLRDSAPFIPSNKPQQAHFNLMAKYVNRQVNRLSIPKLRAVDSKSSLERYEQAFPVQEFNTVQRIPLASLDKQSKMFSRSQSLEKCEQPSKFRNIVVTETKNLEDEGDKT